MADKDNKPAVRVKGFTDDWEEHDLFQIVDVRSGRDYKHLLNGDIPVYGTGGYMLSVNEALSYDQDAVGIGRKGTIDKPYVLKAPFWTVDTLFYSVPKEKNNLNFIYDVFQKINWKQKDESTGVPSLSKVAINDIQVFIPKCDEQSKIGTFFKQLDQFITLHERKYNKLVTIKKSMLEKMFPKNGANVPEIRLNGFTDAWEKHELVDEVEFYSGLTYSPTDVIKNGGTLVLRSSNVKNGEIVYGDNVYVNSNVVNSINVREGDLIVVVRNGSRSLIGKHALIKEIMNNTVIGAFMTGIHSNQSAFINALLDTAQFDKEIEKNLGATINQITTGAFKKMQFMFPDSDEQRKIGIYFVQFDNLIALHQGKLEKLKNIKKAFLEKMFV